MRNAIGIGPYLKNGGRCRVFRRAQALKRLSTPVIGVQFASERTSRRKTAHTHFLFGNVPLPVACDTQACKEEKPSRSPFPLSRREKTGVNEAVDVGLIAGEILFLFFEQPRGKLRVNKT